MLVNCFSIEFEKKSIPIYPFFCFNLPNIYKHDSNITRITDINNKNAFYWKDSLSFDYKCFNYDSIEKIYIFIEIYSDKANKNMKNFFIGDASVPLISILAGCSKHRLEISHGHYKATLYFECTSIQVANTIFKITEYSNEDSRVQMKLKIKEEKQIIKNAVEKEVPLNYDEYSTGVILLLEEDEIKESFKLEMFSENKRQIRYKNFSCSLVLSNVPKYVQSKDGIHLRENLISSYIGYTIPPNCVPVKKSTEIRFSELDCLSFPMGRAQRTINPIKFRLHFDKLIFKFNNSVSDMKYFYLSFPGYLSPILFRLDTNGLYNPISQLPSIEISTKVPYQLTKECLFFSFSKFSDSEQIFELHIPFYSLLTDQDEQCIKFRGNFNGEMIYMTKSETIEKSIFTKFKDIEVSNSPILEDVYINIKIGDNISDIVKGIRQGNDSLYFPKTSEIYLTEKEYEISEVINKNIEFRILWLKNNKYHCFGKSYIQLNDFYPFRNQYNIDFDITDNTKEMKIVASFNLFTNKDGGFYPDFTTNEINAEDMFSIESYQPSLIKYFYNIEYSDLGSDEIIIVFSSKHVSTNKMLIKIDNALNSVLIFEEEIIFKIPISTLVSSVYHDRFLLLSSEVVTLFFYCNDSIGLNKYLTSIKKTNLPEFPNIKMPYFPKPYSSIETLSNDSMEIKSKEKSFTNNEISYYIRCKCDKMIELKCYSCNSNKIELVLWDVFRIYCTKCNSYTKRCTHYVQDFQPPTNLKCDKCFSRENFSQEEIVTAFKCSCSALFNAFCPECHQLPLLNEKYYVSECKKCNQTYFVISEGQVCPFCQEFFL